MERFRLLLISILSLFIVFLGIPLEGDAKFPDGKVINYVALGDSLAAGKPPYPSEENGNGYPEYIAERFEQSNYDISLSNHGENGHTTADVLTDLEDEDIQKDIKEADILTIDIGANDLLAHFFVGDLAGLQSASTTAVDNIDKILSEIRNLNEDVDIYVMGYYNAIEPYERYRDLEYKILPLLQHFNDSIKEVTESADAVFVPTFKVIAKDYDTYLPHADVHLSEEGYQAVAKEFWKKMTPRKYGEYGE
ncbi:Lysophospholipase L1 [Thalassobacillus cyri]|uniref:Lysophospholipase L1 n=1 Tax=Thalassobacillus cyri TaxID=571932 RepID=A0A1H4GXC3_9BACI|nr:GDSL-type esterase/lipase family protein [Thalassobacillus cyri]SEB13538.1 Lysophospholipase L1 [Thalassobacillus cyri]